MEKSKKISWDFEDGTDILYRNVGNQTTPPNIRVQRRPQLHSSGSLQACKATECLRLHINYKYKPQLYRQLSRDILADASFLCDKATVFTDTTKETPCVNSNTYSRCQNWKQLQKSVWLKVDCLMLNVLCEALAQDYSETYAVVEFNC
jgi:hypothetical protein